jgi:hypothetical protein
MKVLISLILPVFVTSFRSQGFKSGVMRWKAHLSVASIKAEWEDESLESSRGSGSRRKLNTAFLADLVRRQLIVVKSYIKIYTKIDIIHIYIEKFIHFFVSGRYNWRIDHKICLRNCFILHDGVS